MFIKYLKKNSKLNFKYFCENKVEIKPLTMDVATKDVEDKVK